MRLNEINDNPGARKKKARVGRGIGSGMGKTSTRGQKGQKARSGVAIKGFEGGQMPIYRRTPRRGFNSRNKVVSQLVNTGRLQKVIEAGRLDPEQSIDRAALAAAGIIRPNGGPVRLLAEGDLRAAVNISVDSSSRQAIAVVEGAGGSVSLPAAEAAE
ncbi:MAG TPA: 50S ribosomal protein L15 [Alphaproteobacteria bacterium]|nr:50S ribosomal protein L15 [Alphaproteobacteria bacterium]